MLFVFLINLYFFDKTSQLGCDFEDTSAIHAAESSVLDNFDGNNLLPHLFQVRLLDPQQTEAFEKQMVVYQGVNRVDYSAKVMSNLSRVIRWVNLGTLAAFIIMGIIALFIISNMVRISTLARGEEISIMKYVGATNTYIRLPYILEGAITGLIGVVLAIAVVYFGYRAGYAHLMANTSSNSFYALLPGSIKSLVPAHHRSTSCMRIISNKFLSSKK